MNYVKLHINYVKLHINKLQVIIKFVVEPYFKTQPFEQILIFFLKSTMM